MSELVIPQSTQDLTSDGLSRESDVSVGGDELKGLFHVRISSMLAGNTRIDFQRNRGSKRRCCLAKVTLDSSWKCIEERDDQRVVAMAIYGWEV